MKIETAKLAAALKSLARIFVRKIQIPTSGFVLVESTGKSLSLTAYDLTQWQSETMECKGPVDSFCVNYNHFCSSLSDAEETELEFSQEAMVVKSGQRVAKLSLMDSKEFPERPAVEKLKAVGFPRAALAAALDAVIGFEHPQETRGILHGVHIMGGNKKITAEGCDGRNAAHYSQSLVCSGFDCVLPDGEAARALSDMLKRSKSQLKISENAIAVEHESGYYQTILMEGKYPSTDNFINAEYEEIGEIETAPLIKEIESALLFRDPNVTPAIHIKFSSRIMELKFTGQFNAQFTAKINGKFSESNANVNGEAFLKCLRSLPEKCVASKGEKKILMEAGSLKIINAELL